MAATALLFDLDGTVWDSYPWYGAALAAPLASSPEIVVARLKAGENVVALAGSAGIRNTRFTRLCRSSSSELRLYAGVDETFIELERRAAPLGVVTNTFPPGFKTRMHSFKNSFRGAICSIN